MAVLEKQNKNKDIEAIYPLSPTQQGMLFHNLYQPESRAYFDQFRFTLEGKLDPSAFEQAWNKVLERHAALRTIFVWKNRKNPLQIVRKQVILPWHNLDWRSLSNREQETQFKSFLNSDRSQGIELDKAPLMRCTLIRVADETYQFVWSFHHLLLDGWSWPILLKEILAFYESIKNGQSLYLPPPRPYRDYINWLQQQDLSSAETFWRETLKGFTNPTPLVVDRAITQSNQQESTCYIRHRYLSAQTTATLKSFAQENYLTLSTLVQAAWALLLSRYSGESDVVFGTVVSGRPPELSGVESIVGLFINTLPARVQIPETSDLLAWLKELQQQNVEREHYSYTSLVDIQSISDIPRGKSLFESIVVFENYPVTAELQQTENVQSVQIKDRQDIGQTHYPLTVVAMPGEELKLIINYDGTRFDVDTIDRMLGHCQTLLEGIVANPHCRPGEIPLLTQAEQQLLLIDWNATQGNNPINCAIHQVFEEQVEKTPDVLAVVYENQQLTYRELNQQANQLAHHLQRLGVKPDVPVGICIERSIEAAIAILGTLKAGGTCLTLDPNYPSDRLTFMISDSQTPVILTQGCWQSLLKTDLPLILLDDGWEQISKESDRNPQSQVTANDLAFIIYTSGSTGTPKGVAVPHLSLTNLIKHHQEKMATGVGVLQFASLSFDVSYHEMFAAWGLGGTLYTIPEDSRKDLDKLINFLSLNPIAKVILPVTIWQQLAETYGEQPHLFHNIREAVACGEQLQITQPMVELFKRLENCSLYNMYGPSEADLVTAYRFSNQPEAWPIYAPIGKPAVNVQIYLLDRNLQPVPIGVPGEIYVSGDGLARGYLNRPDLTDQKFIPVELVIGNSAITHAPLSIVHSLFPQSKFYKTGDLARYLPDGNIEFLGRIDDLVKVRGFRIELTEVEAVLSKHPQISQAVAKVFGESAREKYLVAYFVPIQGDKITVEQLRAFLQSRLPEYMIPSAFVARESFPLTPNGKVDRRALREPTTNRPELAIKFVHPRTPTEELLAGIWQDVLGLEKVGIYDNFFDLGGHSLRAMQAIALIRKVFAKELPLIALFDTPTIADIAQRIETTSDKTQEGMVLPIQPLHLQNQVVPISLTQLEFWFFNQLYPKNPLYHLPLVCRLTGTLNLEALEQSLREIVRRHETLRTTFACVDGQVVYSISPQPILGFSVVDIQEIPDKEAEVRRQAQAEILQPFDFAQGLFLRAKVWRLNPTEHLLVVTTHHIVADGWSFGVITQEISALYTAFSAGKPSPLPELQLQYTDFAVWQRQWLQGEVLASQMSFWQKMLGEKPTLLKLPTDYPRPPKRTFAGGKYPITLSQSLTKLLKLLSQEEGVTLFMTLLGAFQTLLFYYTNQEDIAVVTPIANRRPETEGLIGFFVNLLPLSTNLGDNPTIRQLLKRVREVALGVYTHQEMPFIKLVSEIQPIREPGYTVLAQVMFVFQNTPEQKWEMGDLNLKEEYLEANTDIAEFDLNLTLEETGTGIEGVLSYRSDLFIPETIAKMVEHFQNLLKNIAANPDLRLAEICSILGQTNREQSISPASIKEVKSPQLVEPKNPIEAILLEIWQEVLGMEEISTDDNFFELGGHSMQTLEVMTKLQEACQREIPLHYLFEYPTIARLAGTIDPPISVA
ncbi:non-ribosomal peptide synthetase [Limnofasciculus baicalensis]|uniref:Amino acid adenylation domain-containing protein n=1 Tax=Limnofasciculus baicalensis BBK-W-15 TaxID=2699891 RepID=A0AAE3GMX4_9CYAN|nr:non-ribosomal peptide synthetase [Limnofasciculus baicalensis]MCP2727565.1 amino acid adenylation domain-containing protein [Limnofasciculus baicalensis BBK-W-15]